MHDMGREWGFASLRVKIVHGCLAEHKGEMHVRMMRCVGLLTSALASQHNLPACRCLCPCLACHHGPNVGISKTEKCTETCELIIDLTKKNMVLGWWSLRCELLPGCRSRSSLLHTALVPAVVQGEDGRLGRKRRQAEETALARTPESGTATPALVQ